MGTITRDSVIAIRANLLGLGVSRPVRVRVRGAIGHWQPDPFDWFEVIRVNGKSVTVDTREGIATVPYERLIDAV